MLLQSCAGYIDVLPTLPDVWASGSFEGICARGNFVVSCEWKNKKPYSIRVTSNTGGVCRLKFDGADRAIVDDREYSLDADIISFPTQKGETVNIMIG
jgi:alpha-L-fucosidase 2